MKIGQQIRLKDDVYELVKRQRSNGKGVLYNEQMSYVPFSLIKAYREGLKCTITEVVSDGWISFKMEGYQWNVRIEKHLVDIIESELEKAVDL